MANKQKIQHRWHTIRRLPCIQTGASNEWSVGDSFLFFSKLDLFYAYASYVSVRDNCACTSSVRAKFSNKLQNNTKISRTNPKFVWISRERLDASSNPALRFFGDKNKLILSGAHLANHVLLCVPRNLTVIF